MSLPLCSFLLVSTHRLNSDSFISTVEKSITLRTPCNGIYRFSNILNQGCSQTSISWPYFKISILTGSSKSTSIITPFQTNDRLWMGILNSLLDFSTFIIDSETTIWKSNCKNFTWSLGTGYPIMIDSISVKLQYFSSSWCIRVPFIH